MLSNKIILWHTVKAHVPVSLQQDRRSPRSSIRLSLTPSSPPHHTTDRVKQCYAKGDPDLRDRNAQTLSGLESSSNTGCLR